MSECAVHLKVHVIRSDVLSRGDSLDLPCPMGKPSSFPAVSINFFCYNNAEKVLYGSAAQTEFPPNHGEMPGALT